MKHVVVVYKKGTRYLIINCPDSSTEDLLSIKDDVILEFNDRINKLESIVCNMCGNTCTTEAKVKRNVEDCYKDKDK